MWYHWNFLYSSSFYNIYKSQMKKCIKVWEIFLWQTKHKTRLTLTHCIVCRGECTHAVMHSNSTEIFVFSSWWEFSQCSAITLSQITWNIKGVFYKEEVINEWFSESRTDFCPCLLLVQSCSLTVGHILPPPVCKLWTWIWNVLFVCMIISMRNMFTMIQIKSGQPLFICCVDT